MDLAFTLLTLVVLAAAVAAMSLRHLVACALCLVGVFLAVAGLFLHLKAEFLAFAQVLVYVGAISILIVFALLLTRSRGAEGAPLCARPRGLGLGIAGGVTGLMLAAVLTGRMLPTATAPQPALAVRALGLELMTHQVPALLVVGLLLTAALIGAVVLAVREPPAGGEKEPPA